MRFRGVWAWGTWLLAALPVVYYVGIVLWYAYDFPYMDDYPVVVDFLNRLPGAQTAGDTISLLLEQNNFHRLVLAKAMAWANVLLTGSVDFRVMQWAGLAFLLLTAYLLYQSRTVRKSGTSMASGSLPADVPVSLFLPVLYLLFQFQGWNIAFWSIVGASNVAAPALALLALYLAFRGREGWAMAVALVTLFTNGNGILVLPLLALAWALQRRWIGLIGALLIAIPALLFYFTGYENPSGPALSQLLAPARLLHLLVLDTAFLGAIVYHPAVPWLPVLLGSLTIGWLLWLIRVRYDQQNPMLFWMLMFLHLTGLMLAVNRIQNDTSIVFASRYRNITALHMAVTYLSVLNVLASYRGQWRGVHWHNWLAGGATLATVGLWLVSNLTYQSKITRFRELKETDNLLWQRYGQVRASAPQYQPVAGLNQLARRGTFRPEPVSLKALQSQPVPLPPPATPGDSLQYGLDRQRTDNGFLVVSGWAKVAGRKANFNDTFVGIRTRTGWQYYTTLFHQRLDKEDSANDKDTGFTAIIPGRQPIDSLAIFVRSGRWAAVAKRKQ